MALIRRTVIDILDRGLKKIIVNDKTIFEEVQKLLVNTKNIKVELKEENLFNMYSLENQVKKMENRKKGTNVTVTHNRTHIGSLQIK